MKMEKKLIAVILASLVLCGCGKCECGGNKTEKKDENDASVTKISFGTYMKTVVHDGHEYIVTIKSGGYGCSVDTLHSPNCSCFKKQE